MLTFILLHLTSARSFPFFKLKQIQRNLRINLFLFFPLLSFIFFLNCNRYNWDKVAHNVFYTILGIVIWVGFENLFAFLWATGRLSYLSDVEAFASLKGMAKFWLGLVLIPLWRDFHFYVAHR